MEVGTAFSHYYCYDKMLVLQVKGRISCVFIFLFFGPGKLMKANGNASARALYEKAVPAYYYRPQENDCV